MIEEVKKILIQNYYSLHIIPDTTKKRQPNTKYISRIAQQICQLFPKTEDNPSGYEAKAKVEKGFNPDWEPDLQGIIKDCNKAIENTKTECQKRVDGIWETLEKGYPAITTWPFYNELKKREGVK